MERKGPIWVIDVVVGFGEMNRGRSEADAGSSVMAAGAPVLEVGTLSRSSRAGDGDQIELFQSQIRRTAPLQLVIRHKARQMPAWQKRRVNHAGHTRNRNHSAARNAPSCSKSRSTHSAQKLYPHEAAWSSKLVVPPTPLCQASAMLRNPSCSTQFLQSLNLHCLFISRS